MSLQEESAPGVPEWVVTYGDMMSLLLTFFIMLVSMSELKQDKGEVRAMLDSIRQAFGPTNGLFGVPGRSTQKNSAHGARQSDGARAEGGTKRASRSSAGPAGAHRTVERIDQGAVVTLGGPARFARFDATLDDALKADLDVIAGVLAEKPNRVMVRGHATREPLPDDQPLVFDGFPVHDRWDLSYARARAVADHLVARGIDRRRLLVGAGGDAETHSPARREDERHSNRRVDVFVLDSYISPREAAAPRTSPAEAAAATESS
ncbi:MAG: flagellar motor protein MotB [Planctomycetaceae bacterium]